MFSFVLKILYKLYYLQPSFSQEGEDRILERFFESQKNGFYVDVGANHPRRFSNTYLFYLKGWRGICIDPNFNMSKLFKKSRPHDFFLNIGIGKEKSFLKLYMYDEDALNTFDKDLTDWRLKNTDYKLKEIKEVEVLPLADVFSQMPNIPHIDFMNIDVEGLDLEVLESNDWSKIRPTYLLVENLKQVNNPIERFLKGKNYEMIALTKNTVFFKSTL